MKKLLIVLIVLLVLLTTATVAVGGYAIYLSTHVFVGEDAYKKSEEVVDLRGRDITDEYFLELSGLLPEAKIYWDVPFQSGRIPSSATSINVAALTKDDLARLVYFPELTTIQADNCEDYEVLELLAAQRPDLDIRYTVKLGGVNAEPDAASLTLEDGSFDFDLLMENLSHLPRVTEITLPKSTLGSEKVSALTQAWPDITVTYTIAFRGEEADPYLTYLDLSDLTPEEVEQVAGEIGSFASLQSVELMNAAGQSSLSMEEVRTLQQAAPGAVFHYSFDFFGQTISTTDAEVIVKNKKIGDENEATVRLALDLMETCDRFVLDNCRLSNETMDTIREDYRDKTKVVWRIWFGKRGASLTDAQILRAVYDLQDDNCEALRYLEDVEYIDMGHNEFLDAVPFVAYMPKLKAMIISGAPIKDLEPFRSCKELQFLEIANCMYVTDLSPLAECTKLEMLNISYSHVTDLSPIDDLNLTYLSAVKNKLSDEEEARYAELHPDCIFTLRGHEYGKGWRYDENDKPLPWYQRLIDVFGYPHPYNQVGWYLDD